MYIAVVKCVLNAVHMLQKSPLILLLCVHRIVTFNVEIHQNEDVFWKSYLHLQGKPLADLNAAPQCLPQDLKLEYSDNHTVCIKMPVSTFSFFAFSLAVPSSGLPSEALSLNLPGIPHLRSIVHLCLSTKGSHEETRHQVIGRVLAKEDCAAGD